jgi:hypothetical protein
MSRYRHAWRLVASVDRELADEEPLVPVATHHWASALKTPIRLVVRRFRLTHGREGVSGGGLNAFPGDA